MLVPAEKDFSAAMKKLEDAGFRRTPWSYGIHVHPKLFRTNPIISKSYRRESRSYERLHQHSARFDFPPGFNMENHVVLLESRYVHLSPPSDGQSSNLPYLSIPLFSGNGNLYYPNKVVLLESFVRVLLEEKAVKDMMYTNDWVFHLSAWAISYICGKPLNTGILDTCEDEGVRNWCNKNVR
jgi:hypothetical protein